MVQIAKPKKRKRAKERVPHLHSQTKLTDDDNLQSTTTAQQHALLSITVTIQQGMATVCTSEVPGLIQRYTRFLLLVLVDKD
ncbi:predicted protein [Lichtheimia corymbifera JMRC:FSU:9682]|uniref:Uncharacterized protein n=1 Tax=Lichtheimia corymbifera JMRC:FSU:9682 TaxID=1263082 RepID=A0A068S6W3_9FUNG|nr:predicted protein [Lichtheimia corymbifera JMRC:FSU:9682]